MRHSSNRGGKREGAGRPRVLEGLEHKSVYLDQVSLAILADFQARTGLGFSEAIRALIEFWYSHAR